MIKNKEKKNLVVGNASEYVVGLQHAAMPSYSRKLTKSGAITIPSVLRKRLGMKPKDLFEIREMPEEGVIILKRIKGTCPITGDTTNLVNINGMFLSVDVINALKDMGSDLYNYVNTEEELDFIDTALKISEREENRQERLKEKKENEESAKKKKENVKKGLAKKTKTKRNKKKYYTNVKDRKEILEMNKNGISTKDISTKLNIHEPIVNKVIYDSK